MFTYEYECNRCGVPFTLTLSRMKSEADLIVCPHCSSKEVVRVWNTLNVQYKSGGFYSHPTVHTEIVP